MSTWLVLVTLSAAMGADAAQPGNDPPGVAAGGPRATAPPSPAPASDEPSGLQAEILEIARTGGLEGVRAWAAANRPRLTPELIAGLSERGARLRDTACFRIALSLAESSPDDLARADTCLAYGNYCLRMRDYPQAETLLDQALALYEKAAQPLGQAKVWLGRGQHHRATGKIAEAMAMYERALHLSEAAADLEGQGSAWLGLGECSNAAGERAEALAKYDRAFAFFQQSGSSSGQGIVLHRRGWICFIAGENDQALKFYEQALPLLEAAGNTKAQADVWHGKGDLFFFTGDNDRALQMYDRALALYEASASLGGQGDAWRRKGEVYFYTGEIQKSQEMYEKALSLYDQASDTRGRAHVLCQKGDAYRHTGDIALAEQMYALALPLFEQLSDLLGQASIWLNRAKISYRTGDTREALALYDRALPFYEKMGEPMGQGSVFHNKGDVYLDLGDYGQALLMFDRALPFYEKAGDPMSTGGLWMSRGLLYRMAGDYERARKEFDQALYCYEKTQYVNGQGYIRLFQADTALEQGQLQKAQQLYTLALPLLEQSRNLIGQGNVRKGLGDVYRLSGEFDQALAQYDAGLSFYERDMNLMGQGNIWLSKGDVYLNSGRWRQALAMYERAQPIFERIGAAEIVASLMLSQALAMGGMGRIAAAAELSERGLEQMERVRRQIRLPDLTRSFLAKAYVSYESAALFMLGHGMAERSFRVVESMKARGFLDHLAEARADLAKGIPPELKAERDRRQEHLAAATRKLMDGAVKADAAGLAQLREERQAAEQELSRIEDEIRLKNPLYASVQYPVGVPAGELRQKVLKAGETLVEYFLADEACWAFVATRHSFTAIPLKVSKKDLAAAAQAFIDALEKRRGEDLAGRRLAELVLRPLYRKLSSGDVLWVVPDGVLARVPFEALPVGHKKGKPVYLLDTREVRYVQSATVLAFLRAHGEKGSPAANFMGYGDPVYDYESFSSRSPERGGLFRRSGEGALEEIRRGCWERAGLLLERLPGTGEEVEAIAALFAGVGLGHRTRLRLEACEEAVKGPEPKSAGYIHFACHGLLASTHQSLALSRIPGSAEDGFLDLGEIMNLDWNARLVVLSACETGKGKLERGEGVTGLTRAVMYAGTPAVAASLWSVSDEGTADLMKRFYRHLIKGRQPPAAALRAAKREMLRGGADRKAAASSSAQLEPFSRPFFWAAFVLYGE